MENTLDRYVTSKIKLCNVPKDEKKAYEKEADKQDVAFDVWKELVILPERAGSI